MRSPPWNREYLWNLNSEGVWLWLLPVPIILLSKVKLDIPTESNTGSEKSNGIIQDSAGGMNGISIGSFDRQFDG